MSETGTTARDEAVARLREEFGHLLGAERRLRGREQHRAEGELSFAHVRALFALGEREEATAGEIAKAAQLSPATVTGMLDDLEAAGIVSRQRSATDRRVVLVSLTGEGWTLLERKRARWRELWDGGLADVSDADLDAAARVMRAIADTFDAI